MTGEIRGGVPGPLLMTTEVVAERLINGWGRTDSNGRGLPVTTARDSPPRVRLAGRRRVVRGAGSGTAIQRSAVP